MKVEDKNKANTFGWGLAGLFLIFSLVRWVFKGETGLPWQFFVAIGIAVINLVIPVALFPVYKAAMFIAHCLGWFNTRLFLALIFFLVFTPMALIFKISGKDFLDRKFNRGAKSYWIKREKHEFDPARVEQQF
jgi:hypothetical protein